MRILLASSEVARGSNVDGGLGQAVVRIARALADSGHEIHVLSHGKKSKERHRSGVIFESVAVPVPAWVEWADFLSLRQFNLGINGLLMARAVGERVVEINREQPVDIVQFSHLGGLGFFRPKNIPVVIRFSSDTPSCRRLGAYSNQNRIAMFQAENLERMAIRRADAIYSPSHHVAEIAQNRYRRPVRVIRPPVFSEIDPADYDDSILKSRIGDHRFLLFFGRLNRLKGLFVLGEILSRALNEYPEMRVVFIGRGESESQEASMVAYLRDKAGENADRLIFINPIPHPVLYPIIKRATAVLVPSMIDNLPNAMLESMLHGRIVIGTRGTGVDELIEDGISGVLCRPNDPDDLLAAVRRCLSLSATAREDIGRAARKRVDELRPEKSIPELVSFFEETRHNFLTSRGH